MRIMRSRVDESADSVGVGTGWRETLPAARRRRLAPLRVLPVAAMIAALHAPAFTQPDSEGAPLERQAQRAIAAKDWPEAHRTLEKILASKPHDAEALFNIAAVLAQLGEPGPATSRLIESIQYGFVDLHRLERDARFKPIRETKEYKAVILGWRALLDARADSNERALRNLLDGRYHYERDPSQRLIYASAFNEQSFAIAKQEIANVSAWAYATLFDPPIENTPKPDAWVSVLLPTPEDFTRFLTALGVGPNIGGLYDHTLSQLICQDIGPSLRHEFLHVLHWRILARQNQSHPDWVMEGLGSLVEQMEADDSAPGGLRPTPDWRTNIAKRLLDMRRLLPLDDLMSMDRRTFRGRHPSANYAQARTFMLFLSDRGLLSDFFHTLKATDAADATGRAAVEQVFQKPLNEVEREYRTWLAELPMVAERIRPGMANLGVEVAAGRGDGPVIDEIISGTPAVKSGLRRGDVILSVDGQSTRTLPALVQAIAAQEPGDIVTVEVRRGRLMVSVSVELVALDDRK